MLRILAAFLLSAALPTAAEACRIHVPGDQRIEQGYEKGYFETVAHVRVTQVRDEPRQGGLYTERFATARTLETLSGENAAEQVEFVAHGLVSSCGWPPPVMPEVGDELILYLGTNGAGERYVWLMLTRGDAMRFDRRLKTLGLEPVETPDLSR